MEFSSHCDKKRQRRMGVEPTRDRAERPPSRFEDGETHRGPYTSIESLTSPYWEEASVLCHFWGVLSSQSAHGSHIDFGERAYHQFGFAQSQYSLMF